jgi:hypothetical protein
MATITYETMTTEQQAAVNAWAGSVQHHASRPITLERARRYVVDVINRDGYRWGNHQVVAPDHWCPGYLHCVRCAP